jgi:hypothetical protein
MELYFKFLKKLLKRLKYFKINYFENLMLINYSDEAY